MEKVSIADFRDKGILIARSRENLDILSSKGWNIRSARTMEHNALRYNGMSEGKHTAISSKSYGVMLPTLKNRNINAFTRTVKYLEDRDAIITDRNIMLNIEYNNHYNCVSVHLKLSNQSITGSHNNSLNVGVQLETFIKIVEPDVPVNTKNISLDMINVSELSKGVKARVATHNGVIVAFGHPTEDRFIEVTRFEQLAIEDYL